MTISILLPYKENYSKSNAGAVSLFVNDISRKSEYKNKILIFGSTSYNDYLSSNYINLSSQKNFLKSTNNEYVKEFVKNKYFNETKLLEIHNRPNYIKLLKPYFSENIFLYFHNDPLTMNGSKELKEREYLIKNVDKILFNSEWSKKDFLLVLII